MDGTGDHENFFNRNETHINALIDGKLKKCKKSALRIRNVNEHINWPNAIYNQITILFSKLTKSGLNFYTEDSLDDIEHEKNDTMVTYHSAIKAEYG